MDPATAPAVAVPSRAASSCGRTFRWPPPPSGLLHAANIPASYAHPVHSERVPGPGPGLQVFLHSACPIRDSSAMPGPAPRTFLRDVAPAAFAEALHVGRPDVDLANLGSGSPMRTCRRPRPRAGGAKVQIPAGTSEQPTSGRVSRQEQRCYISHAGPVRRHVVPPRMGCLQPTARRAAPSSHRRLIPSDLD